MLGEKSNEIPEIPQNIVEKISKKNRRKKNREKITSDSAGGSSPASSNRTFHCGFSLNRLATTDPALPAPITIKSYSSRPLIGIFLSFFSQLKIAFSGRFTATLF